jgi:formylglycine-generating enzyme required for sulfatase activity
MSGIAWCEVPAGPFTMGSDPAAEHAPDPDEAPAHRVLVPAFRLGRVPVTNAEYLVFVSAAGHPAPSHWPGRAIPRGREAHPVTYVSWEDALAFGRWAGGRLPSEAEWERAARGDDGRAWPWGDGPPSPELAVFGGTDTAPVGTCPAGASPFGALDLAGNVWEWTASMLRQYPYAAGDGREDTGSAEPRVVRGGSYIHGAGEIRCSYRHGLLPGVVDHYVGFRLATDPGVSLAHDASMVDVPGGEVLLGNDPRPSGGPAAPDETPQHEASVAAVSLSATPVTNAQYRAFVDATKHPRPPHWPNGAMPQELAEHPVTHVDWHDANAFCRWAGARLPTEAEWEKAARGTDARLYPWGAAEPRPDDLSRASFGGGAKYGRTTEVGAHPDGASPYGLLDMAGNVWEWVSSVYAPYPYDPADGREDLEAGLPRALRGGSFASPTSRNLRCAARSRSAPGRRSPHIGFRVAREGNG